MTKPESPGVTEPSPDAAEQMGIQDAVVEPGHEDDSTTAGSAEQTDTGATNTLPEAESEPDFSFLSDDLQKALKDNPEMTAAELLALEDERGPTVKRGYLRRDKFSQNQNALKAERDEVAQAMKDAENYRILISDPTRRDEVLALLQRDEPDQEEALPEDVDTWGAREILAHQRERERKLTERVRAQTREEIMGELRAPRERINQFDAVAAEYMESNDVPAEVMQEAVNAIATDQTLLSGLTPETLPGALRLAVSHVESTMSLASLQKARESTKEKIVGAGAASPRGQSGAAAPEHRSFAEVNGREFGAEDAYDRMLKRLGTTESDLDKALRFTKK